MRAARKGGRKADQLLLLIISCQEKEEEKVEEGLHGHSPRDVEGGEDDKEGDTNDDKGNHSRRNNN